MQLIYLSHENLNDRLFIKDFVHNFKWQEPTLVLHATFGGTVKDTYFVTKRISALLSEALVHNTAFSAAQRDFFYVEDGKMQVAKAKLEKLFSPIPLVILSPIVKKEGVETLADPLEMLTAARAAFEVGEITFFANNPLSMLASKKMRIATPEDLQHALHLYEEESTVLQRAFEFKPARVCSPVNYSM